MESLSSYSASIQLHGPLILCSQQAAVLQRVRWEDHQGPTPQSHGAWGAPAYGTPLGHSSGGGVTIRPPCSQTLLVLVSIRIYFYKLVCGWLAACPCPHLLPLPRQVSWLPSTPTVAHCHLNDISCPGREQGSSACTWCLARVPWAGPGGTFPFSLSEGSPP